MVIPCATGASLRWSINTSTLAHRCRRAASTPSPVAARQVGRRGCPLWRSSAARPNGRHGEGFRAPAIVGRTTLHPGYGVTLRIRKRIEEAFGWAKTVASLRKARHRGLPKIDWQFTFAMAAYNLVRLPKLSGAVA
jgi:hypothetical protein